jgi:hypothetical protein
MAQPIISWRDTEGAPVAEWNIGNVEAGTQSDVFTVLLCNNFGNATTNVADMLNVQITTRDTLGGNSGDIVANRWTGVRILNSNTALTDPNFTMVGGNISRAARAFGATIFNSITSTPGIAPNYEEGESVDILGVRNDGILNNSRGNFVQMELMVSLPRSAVIGFTNFAVRALYQFI